MNNVMDPRWVEAREAGRLVRMEHVRTGETVLSAYNGMVRRVASDLKPGLAKYLGPNGEEWVFADCAEALRLEAAP